MIKSKPHLKDLYRTDPDEKERLGYIRLDMNEGVPGLPQLLIKRALSNMDSAYLSTYPEYADTTRIIARHNGVSPKNICLANGSDAAIKYIFDAYVSRRDKVLLTDPTFAMYPVYCRIYDARPITVSYKKDLLFPFEDFMKKLKSNIRLAVIVNPNNPTGDVLEPGRLISVIKKARDNDILLIVDEAYFYFYPHSVIRQVRKFNNLIVLRTFSKLCGLAGIRLGYAAACDDIIRTLKKVKPTYDVNSLALRFCGKILDGSTLIRKLVAESAEGKRYLERQLDKEGIDYNAGHANFVLIKCGDRVGEVIKKLAASRILVGGGFRQLFLKDYIRVTTGQKNIMEKFWKVFIKIWTD